MTTPGSTLLFAVLFSITLGAVPGLVAAAELVDLPDQPLERARLFETQRCAECHAVGDSAEQLGPNLGRLDLRVSFLDAAARMWNKAPSMEDTMLRERIDRPTPSGDQLLELLAFISADQYYLSRVGRAAEPARGELLFDSKGCSHCHLPRDGEEESIGPSLSDYGSGSSVLDIAQAMINHASGMQEEIEKQLVQHPHFREGEMADLLSYLASTALPQPMPVYIEPGSPRRGAATFERQGCVKCHSIRGEGGDGDDDAPDLGRKPKAFVRDYADVAAAMWNHSVPMFERMRDRGVSLPELRESDLADLVAYLFYINYADEPGDPVRGHAIFNRKGCVACHRLGPTEGWQEGGAIREPTQFKGTADLLAAMWRAAPAMRHTLDSIGQEWPTFQPGEMADLTAWLLSGDSFWVTRQPSTPVDATKENKR